MYDEGLEKVGAFAPTTPAEGIRGQLIPLKTTLELRAGDSVVDVYITTVPLKEANFVLSRLHSLLESISVDLQHLRRLVTFQNLPGQVRRTVFGEPSQVNPGPASGRTAEELFLLIAPTYTVDLPVLSECLLSTNVWKDGTLPAIHTVVVPLLAPTSQEQAKSWSLSHWPTIYKKNNPFGPHPSIISRAESEIQPEVSTWMSMATRAALFSQKGGHGMAIGAVIVQRSDGESRAVALAGDGRWIQGGRDCNPPGNVMAHAVLRGIAMIAQKLRVGAEMAITETDLPSTDCEDDDVFVDTPIGMEERNVFDNSQLSPDGYLCHNLEIYLTHEPCVMCSMAILHSRFGRVVFGQRMNRTGALCSEVGMQETSASQVGLGHGLFWRKELNWCLMAWQYCAPEFLDSLEIAGPTVHA